MRREGRPRLHRPLAVLAGLLLWGLSAPALAMAASPLTWSSPFVADPPVGGLNYMSLIGISCPTRSLCAASGGFTDVASSTNPGGGPGAWSSTGSIDPNGLISIACPSAGLCIAGDDEGSVLSSTSPFGPSAHWSAPQLIDPVSSPLVPVRGLTAAACPTTSLCVLADQFGGVLTSTRPTGGASAWSTRADVDAQNQITGLACPTVTLCVAVDSAGNVITSKDPTGGAAQWQVAAIDPARVLSGISCPSTALCVAVDEQGDVFTSQDPAAGGPSWHQSASLGAGRLFTAVSCAPTSLCVAVTRAGGAVVTLDPTGSGGAWSGLDLGAPQLTGVSCRPAQCVVVSGYGRAVVGTWVGKAP